MDNILKTYLELIQRDHTALDARGVMQVQSFISMGLEEVFIPLTARIKRKTDSSVRERTRTAQGLAHDEQGFLVGTPVDLFKSDDVFTEEKDLTLEQLAQRHPRWVILGDPGAGKTTLLRHQAQQVAKAYLDGDAELLPVYITLRYFAEWFNQPDTEANLLSYLEQKGLTEDFKVENIPTLTQHIKHALQQGKALLLLDGLDEQRDAETKRRTVQAIDNLNHSYPNNRIWVTSRIIGYDAAPLSSSFQTATLGNFNDRQIKDFLHAWIYAVEKHNDILSDDITQKRAQRKAEELISRVFANNGIKKLATNPLLCTIIALIHQQGGALPHNRAELYKLCIDTFIFNWEMHKRKQGSSEESLDAEATQAVLEQIALYLQEQTQSNRAPRQILLKLMAQFLQDEQGLTETDAKQKANRLLDLIRDVAGLFIDKGNDEYAFFHLTFQEYLTARAITRKRRLIDEYLAKYLFNPKWREVIYLAAAHQGMKSEEQGSEFIEVVWRQQHTHNDAMAYSLRLALLCAQQTRLELDTSDRLLKEWVELFFSKPFLRARLMDCLGKYGKLRYRAETMQPLALALQQDSDADTRGQAAQALGQLKANEAVPELLRALQQDANERVRSRAVWALNDLQDATAVPVLCHALQHDSDNGVRFGAAFLLGELQANTAFPELCHALQNDSDEGVRECAAWALSKSQDTTTSSVLLHALRYDKDESVRYTAADALSELQDTETSFSLLYTLQHDLDKSVRANAAQALGNLRDTKALSVLRHVLQYDLDESVRASAARAIGELEANTECPELLYALKHDSHKLVRACAAEALAWTETAEASSALLHALQHDTDASVRAKAAQALGWLQDTKLNHGPALRHALQYDLNESVRASAAEALGELQDVEASSALCHVLQNDSNEQVRYSAAEALGYLQDTKASAALCHALQNDIDDRTRLRSAKALGQLQVTSASSVLCYSLQYDTDEQVRRHAAEALGKLQDNKVSPALLHALQNDLNKFVRINAAEALGELKDNSIIPGLLTCLKKEEDSEAASAIILSIEKLDLGSAL